jgi:hypothetical protein
MENTTNLKAERARCPFVSIKSLAKCRRRSRIPEFSNYLDRLQDQRTVQVNLSQHRSAVDHECGESGTADTIAIARGEALRKLKLMVHIFAI